MNNHKVTKLFLVFALFALCSIYAFSQKWEWKSFKDSPITVTAGPNMLVSYIPVKYVSGPNHDFGYDISATLKGIYLDFNHSVTDSYFTYAAGAVGYSFAKTNERNGMIISPSFGMGTVKTVIPTLIGYYRHTFYTLGPGVDLRFCVNDVVMGATYRYNIVAEDHRASVHSFCFNFGYKF